jgi:hypothetical protein
MKPRHVTQIADACNLMAQRIPSFSNHPPKSRVLHHLGEEASNFERLTCRKSVRLVTLSVRATETAHAKDDSSNKEP